MQSQRTCTFSQQCEPSLGRQFMRFPSLLLQNGLLSSGYYLFHLSVPSHSVHLFSVSHSQFPYHSQVSLAPLPNSYTERVTLRHGYVGHRHYYVESPENKWRRAFFCSILLMSLHYNASCDSPTSFFSVATM